jgi:hypothetical protein
MWFFIGHDEDREGSTEGPGPRNQPRASKEDDLTDHGGEH